MRHLIGHDFVALVRISVPAGNTMKVVAEPGQRCDRVPAGSLAELERRGKIKRAERKERDHE